MRLPLDPGRIVRSRLYALAQNTRRPPCDGYGYKLRRSCAHGRLASCPLCDQDVTYTTRPGGIVEINPHRRQRGDQ